MRELHVGGATVLTTDVVARQLLLYARELAEGGECDVVDIPIAMDGTASTCAVLVGVQGTMAAVRIPGTESGVLHGEDAALFDLQRRSDELRGRRERRSSSSADARDDRLPEAQLL